MRDRIYEDQLKTVPDFEFNEEVVSVFPDMIQRSVPGYATILKGIGLMARHYLEEDDRCYDLGCSLGASSGAILSAVGDRKVRIEAVDAAPDMIRQAKLNISDTRVNFHLSDICTIDLQPCQMVVLNLVLQFIDPPERPTLIKKIFDCLKPGGILVVTEKIVSTPVHEQLHLEFKAMNGYSELEIAQKRSALEEVMKIEKLESHINTLNQAGFRETDVWFRFLNWVSILAIK